ncbi:hypothetical protein E4U42_000831 [Claviceps africana]|uniref:Uncharacterized protein n=1 Tax=Claviceps africana TaxID=83212 RepID=A0A8K0NIA0_9HYPO|nr:hypothetical protein E4U42_000831 [Claviceps africana]
MSSSHDYDENGMQTSQLSIVIMPIFSSCIYVVHRTFAVNIATLCLGNAGGAAGAAGAVNGAVNAVVKAEGLVSQVGKILTSDTLQKLAECVQALLDLYPVIQDMIDAVGQLDTDSSVDIPSMDIISGTGKGDADATAIVTVASWDKWILESDNQMEFAVGEQIEGAADYRLGLRKHVINGKQLAQAQAESVKAGYEYVQAQMEVVVSQQQIEGLQKLRDRYEDQEEIYAMAESMLYDRAMALRTTVVISLRNLTWAYRYWALAESSVVLDANKNVVEYQQDLSTIVNEIENVDSRYSSDNQPFQYDIDSKNLPSGFGTSMVAGILGTSHTASFTLEPEGDLASDFNEGWHYRLSGLYPTLRGIVPKSSAIKDGVAVVNLKITSSGIYTDIYKKQLFRFSSLPQMRRCSYEADSNGVRGKTRWKIKFLNPDNFVLDGLQGIDMKFKGRVKFDEQRRRLKAAR